MQALQLKWSLQSAAVWPRETFNNVKWTTAWALDCAKQAKPHQTRPARPQPNLPTSHVSPKQSRLDRTDQSKPEQTRQSSQAEQTRKTKWDQTNLDASYCNQHKTARIDKCGAKRRRPDQNMLKRTWQDKAQRDQPKTKQTYQTNARKKGWPD